MITDSNRISKRRNKLVEKELQYQARIRDTKIFLKSERRERKRKRENKNLNLKKEIGEKQA